MSLGDVGDGVRDAMARVRIEMRTLGALESSMAQEVIVEPVVTTSSMRRMCLPAIFVGFVSLKMLATFVLRSV